MATPLQALTARASGRTAEPSPAAARSTDNAPAASPAMRHSASSRSNLQPLSRGPRDSDLSNGARKRCDWRFVVVEGVKTQSAPTTQAVRGAATVMEARR
jgi:hypothetical protein